MSGRMVMETSIEARTETDVKAVAADRPPESKTKTERLVAESAIGLIMDKETKRICQQQTIYWARISVLRRSLTFSSQRLSWAENLI